MNMSCLEEAERMYAVVKTTTLLNDPYAYMDNEITMIENAMKYNTYITFANLDYDDYFEVTPLTMVKCYDGMHLLARMKDLNDPERNPFNILMSFGYTEYMCYWGVDKDETHLMRYKGYQRFGADLWFMYDINRIDREIPSYVRVPIEPNQKNDYGI